MDDRPAPRGSYGRDFDEDRSDNRFENRYPDSGYGGRADRSERGPDRYDDQDRDDRLAGEGFDNPSYPDRRYRSNTQTANPTPYEGDPWAED